MPAYYCTPVIGGALDDCLVKIPWKDHLQRVVKLGFGPARQVFEGVLQQPVEIFTTDLGQQSPKTTETYFLHNDGRYRAWPEPQEQPQPA